MVSLFQAAGTGIVRKALNDLVICEMYLTAFWIEWNALIGVSLLG
jgi:hypothetical protein